MTSDKDTLKMINRCPKFMHPELDRVENWDDLLFQIAHEIDLAEAGELDWTRRQMHSAKMYHGAVYIAKMDWEHEHPEQVDDLNFAQC